MVRSKICIFTGSRAEYSHLRPLMEDIRGSSCLVLRVLVSGTHLSPEYGLTYKDIERDGFPINEKVEMLLSSDTPEAVCTSMGVGLAGFGSALRRMAPQAIVILGDRYEAFSAAASAMVSRVPIVHFNGGEATYGLIDESIRHSITKMSHLHFTSTREYRSKVIQLGEDPRRVFCVGALSLDTLRRTALLDRLSMEKLLGIHLGTAVIAVTFHPVTLEDRSAGTQVRELLAAVDRLKDTTVIFTKTNADPNGRIVNTLIDAYVAKHPGTARSVASLGSESYFSLLSHADAVVGNSSSGIIEAPSLGIPTVNIGDRQRGRIRAASVLDCAPTAGCIAEAIGRALSPAFRRMCKGVVNPYGNGDASRKAVSILEEQMETIDLKKEFYIPPGWRGSTPNPTRKRRPHG